MKLKSYAILVFSLVQLCVMSAFCVELSPQAIQGFLQDYMDKKAAPGEDWQQYHFGNRPQGYENNIVLWKHTLEDEIPVTRFVIAEFEVFIGPFFVETTFFLEGHFTPTIKTSQNFSRYPGYEYLINSHTESVKVAIATMGSSISPHWQKLKDDANFEFSCFEMKLKTFSVDIQKGKVVLGEGSEGGRSNAPKGQSQHRSYSIVGEGGPEMEALIRSLQKLRPAAAGAAAEIRTVANVDARPAKTATPAAGGSRAYAIIANPGAPENDNIQTFLANKKSTKFDTLRELENELAQEGLGVCLSEQPCGTLIAVDVGDKLFYTISKGGEAGWFGAAGAAFFRLRDGTKVVRTRAL